MDNALILKLLLSIVFGAILGLETETREVENKGKEGAAKSEKDKIGGLRTYTVISLLGGISGILFVSGSYIISYILLISIIVFVLIAYILNVQLKKAFGITTEIAILITFIIGFLTTSSLVNISVILVILVLLTFFLSQKRGLGSLIAKIDHKEVIDVMKFGLVAIVILPLLPNTNYSIQDILRSFNIPLEVSLSLLSEQLFNPFQLWFTVVVISGISLLTYTLSKFIGSKASLILSGILGGFVSSTATIASLTHRAKIHKDERMQVLLAGIGILSNAVSILTLSVLIFINSVQVLLGLLPFIITFLISGVVIGLILYALSNKSQNTNGLEFEYQAFSVQPAIKFVALILTVRIIVQLLLSLNVNSILLLVFTSLSGLVGIDAPSVAFSGLFSNQQITFDLAIGAIIVTILINIIGKIIYAFVEGNRKFAIHLSLGMLISFIIAVIIQVL